MCALSASMFGSHLNCLETELEDHQAGDDGSTTIVTYSNHATNLIPVLLEANNDTHLLGP
jgi:hypothetical protein